MTGILPLPEIPLQDRDSRSLEILRELAIYRIATIDLQLIDCPEARGPFGECGILDDLERDRAYVADIESLLRARGIEPDVRTADHAMTYARQSRDDFERWRKEGR